LSESKHYHIFSTYFLSAILGFQYLDPLIQLNPDPTAVGKEGVVGFIELKRPG
jgi:hypothetical protein